MDTLSNAWPACGRGGGGRGQGRGEADIEAYYSPSMVEDPWRSLRQPQTRQQGAAAGQSPPQLGGNQAAPATGLSTSAHVAAEEEPLVGGVHPFWLLVGTLAMTVKIFNSYCNI